MSDATQGEGWWQASDGKWYPPEQHPDYQAGATQPIEAMPPPTAAMPPVPPPPVAGGPPIGPPPGAPAGPPPGAPGAGSNNAKWIIGGVAAVAVIAIAAFLLLGGDDKKSNVAVTSSGSSSSSTKSSSSSSKSTTTTSSSSSSSFTTSDLQALMLTASDVAPDFVDDKFVNDNGPTNCGQPNADQTIPPKASVGSQSSNGVGQFREEAKVYNTSVDAKKVLDLIKSQTDQSTCPNPTIQGGEPVAFSQPKDVSSSLSTPVEAAFEIDFQTPEAQGQFFVIQDGVAIVAFTFAAPQGTDISQLPNAIDIVNKGLLKIVNS